jgi:hypothetical protein
MANSTLKTRALIVKYINRAKAEASFRDEIERYLTGPWADQLTEELESAGKRWFWWGAGAGLVVFGTLGWALGHFL